MNVIVLTVWKSTFKLSVYFLCLIFMQNILFFVVEGLSPTSYYSVIFPPYMMMPWKWPHGGKHDYSYLSQTCAGQFYILFYIQYF